MSKEAQAFPGTVASIDERQPLIDIPSNEWTIEEGRVPEANPQPRNWKKFLYPVALWLIVAAVFDFSTKSFISSDNIDLVDLKKALEASLDGGISGAAATFCSVLTLMPLRTVMNFQYRYGTTISEATHTLSADGGWTRYYQGLFAALIQCPLARFGDTAANAGVLALFQSTLCLKDLPTLIKTIFASLAAAGFRMILTPVDTVKTIMQTEGNKGLPLLRQRMKQYGIGTLWYGALATALAGFVGHYPWFGTYNFLQGYLPDADSLIKKLLRHAFIGFVASAVSDSISNSLRVVKTYCQVHETQIGYIEATRAVIAADGVKGVLGRGLRTRILTNGIQGILFAVLWKIFQDLL